MAGEKFRDYQFGFENQEEFVAAVNTFMQKRRESFNGDTDWLDELDESRRQAAVMNIESSRKRFEELEKAVENMPGLYSFVRGIYDEILQLEDDGLDELDIARRFLDRTGVIRPITQLIQNGLEESSWGYKFIQAFVNVKKTSKGE